VKAYIIRELRSGSYEEIIYDPFKRPIKSTLFTDPSKSSKYEERVWTYDGQDRIVLEAVSQYDRYGNVTLSSSTSFTYNVDDQVISSTEIKP